MHLERGMIDTLDAIKIATEAPSPKKPVPVEPSASAQALVLAAVFDFADPRLLLVCYYFFRGVSLLVLPWLLSDAVHPSMLVFIIVYGLDWVATVPPTAALCREAFGSSGTIVFGWVFASEDLWMKIRNVRRISSLRPSSTA
jgi:hypothetical protein